MAIFNRYPYTNFQELNLDWILQELKELTDSWNDFQNQYEGITASAQTVPNTEGADVTVTGGDGEPFNFDFKIPAGKDLRVVSTQVSYGISTSSNVQPSEWFNTVPEIPQAYYLWTRTTLFFSDNTSSLFYSVSRNGLDGTGSVVSVNNISPDAQGNISLPLPQPSNITPIMDSEYGNEGTSTLYARGDHSHVRDNTKLDKQTGQTSDDENAYIIDGISTQTIKPISASSVPDAIVKYSTNGTLLANRGTGPNEVVRNQDLIDGYVPLSTLSNLVKYSDIATSSQVGLVAPDNSTITVNNAGVLSAVPSGLNFTLEWENETPLTYLANQKITLDLSTAKAVLIEAYSTTTGGWSAMPNRYKFTAFLPIDYTGNYPVPLYGSYMGWRHLEVDTTGVTFGQAQYTQGQGPNDQSNSDTMFLPIRIWSIS